MIHDKIIAAAVSKEGLPGGGSGMEMLAKRGGPAAADRLMRRSGWF